jgi:hypothetical protein
MGAPNTELAFSFPRFAEGFDVTSDAASEYADLLSDCVAVSEYFVEDGTTVLDHWMLDGHLSA